jgi:hypothetical protein
VKLLTSPNIQHLSWFLLPQLLPPLPVPGRDLWLLRTSVEAMVMEKLAGHQGGAQPTRVTPLLAQRPSLAQVSLSELGLYSLFTSLRLTV